MITSEPWFPGFVTGTLALIGVLGVAALQTWRERRKASEDRNQASTAPTPPSTQQVWERLNDTEIVLRAAISLIGEVADQWAEPHPPVLSKRNVDILVDKGYLPSEWVPKLTTPE